MKNIQSHILLVIAMLVGWTFGFSNIRFPDSFEKRGALPTVDEWRGMLTHARVNH